VGRMAMETTRNAKLMEKLKTDWRPMGSLTSLLSCLSMQGYSLVLRLSLPKE